MSQLLYYLYLNNRQTGPNTFEQIQAMWNNGEVTGETLYWIEGLTDWQPLSSMSDLLHSPARLVPPPPLARLPSSIKVAQRPNYKAQEIQYNQIAERKGWETKPPVARIIYKDKEINNVQELPKMTFLSFFDEIKCRNDALLIIKQVSHIYYLYAVLVFSFLFFGQLLFFGYDLISSIIGIIIGIIINALIIPLINALIGFLLWRFLSRFVAVVMLIITCVEAVYFPIVEVLAGLGWKGWIAATVVAVSSLIFIFVNVRAVEATFKVHAIYTDVNE